MKINPIGEIRSPYKIRREAPHQGFFKPEVISNIEVFKKYEEGLKDIEGFSHIIVLYWMSKSKGYTLQITTPWDTNYMGYSQRDPRIDLILLVYQL